MWGKYCRTGQVTDDNMTHVALHAGYLRLQTHTHTQCNKYFMLFHFAQSRFSGTQYVGLHRPSCFRPTTLLDLTHRICFFAVNFNTKFISIPRATTFWLICQLHAMLPRGYPSEYWPHPMLLLNSSELTYMEQVVSLTQPLANAHTQLDTTMCNALFPSRFQTKFPRHFSSLTCEPHVQPNWSFPVSLPS